MLNFKETEEKIEDTIKSLPRDLAAQEVLNWLITNVESFIDNQKKFFRIDLILNNSTEFTYLDSIQKLYESLSDENLGIESDKDEEKINFVNKNKAILNTLVDEIRVEIGRCELMKKLFERMIFYYEMTGITKRGLIINKLIGEIEIPLFVYDDFKVEVSVKNKQVNSQTGEETEVATNQHVIMPGFSLELEISFVKEQDKVSLF